MRTEWPLNKEAGEGGGGLGNENTDNPPLQALMFALYLKSDS